MLPVKMHFLEIYETFYILMWVASIGLMIIWGLCFSDYHLSPKSSPKLSQEKMRQLTIVFAVAAVITILLPPREILSLYLIWFM